MLAPELFPFAVPHLVVQRTRPVPDGQTDPAEVEKWGIVGLRTGLRRVHFGEMPMPDDVDDLLINREGLERVLAGRPAA